MKSNFFLLNTLSKNKYFYDLKVNRIFLCHPVFHYLLKLKTKGTNLGNWIEKLSSEYIKIENYGCFSKKEIAYYYKKILLLLNNGYFSKPKREKILNRRVTSDAIKKQLANIKQITFEVTDSCNLKCKYCGYGKYYKNYDKREKINLNVHTAINLIRYLSKLWNSSFNFSHNKNIYIGFYGGEPLLNFSFIKEIVKHINNLKVLHNRFTFSITTNAILLEKYIDFLVEHNFNLLISLDGNKENNGYRIFKNGKPAYDIILRNIKAIQKKYPEYFENKVNFNAVIHNKNSVSDIYRYFKDNFDKIPNIGELNTSGIDPSQKDEFWEKYTNTNRSLRRSNDNSLIEKEMFIGLPHIRSIDIFLRKYSGYVYNDYNELIFSNENQKITPTGTCFPFSKKVYVTVNGKILPCERIGHQHALGYVYEKRVKLDFEKIAEKYNKYYDKMMKQCILCFNNKACAQCIFHMNIEDKHPKCNSFMDADGFSKYLNTHISYIEKNPKIYSKIMEEVVIE